MKEVISRKALNELNNGARAKTKQGEKVMTVSVRDLALMIAEIKSSRFKANKKKSPAMQAQSQIKND